jgi:hypothetical protein
MTQKKKRQPVETLTRWKAWRGKLTRLRKEEKIPPDEILTEMRRTVKWLRLAGEGLELIAIDRSLESKKEKRRHAYQKNSEANKSARRDRRA